MSADPGVLADSAVAPLPCAVTPIRSAGNIGAPFVALAIGAVLVLFHETVWSMISLWWRSQTFAHGFMIVPISAWLVWRQRERLALLPQSPCIPALLLLAILGAAWLMASVANVQVLTQYAVTAMIPATVIAIMGWQAARAIAFPLAYLLLAVPFGEIFVPPLIDFTANFTVGALQMTGVPVFRENNFFSIPSGNWSVVDACSGLRYVIASVALGTLYAYLNYHSMRRRLMFIAVALVLPVFANGVRAYSIVMIGHWSGMRLAVGVDHLIYGWVFFGFVSMLLFWVGSFWRDQAAPLPSDRTPKAPFQPGARRNLACAAGACMAICASWSLYAAALACVPADIPENLVFATPPHWQAGAWPVNGWQAAHAGNPARFARSFANAHGAITLQVASYASQMKDAELLTPMDASTETASGKFREIDSGSRHISVGAHKLTVRQAILQGPVTRLLVWRWYRQGTVDTISGPLVKLLLARSKLLRMREDGAEIIVTAPFDEQAAPAQAQLEEFLAAMLPAIDQGLDHVASR